MFIYIGWLFAGVILWKIARDSRHIIGKHAWVGYACSAIIMSTTLIEVLGRYAG